MLVYSAGVLFRICHFCSKHCLPKTLPVRYQYVIAVEMHFCCFYGNWLKKLLCFYHCGWRNCTSLECCVPNVSICICCHSNAVFMSM